MENESVSQEKTCHTKWDARPKPRPVRGLEVLILFVSFQCAGLSTRGMCVSRKQHHSRVYIYTVYYSIESCKD